jgi:hypothetical protein
MLLYYDQNMVISYGCVLQKMAMTHTSITGNIDHHVDAAE